jgi:hypothetical protein
MDWIIFSQIIKHLCQTTDNKTWMLVNQHLQLLSLTMANRTWIDNLKHLFPTTALKICIKTPLRFLTMVHRIYTWINLKLLSMDSNRTWTCALWISNNSQIMVNRISICVTKFLLWTMLVLLTALPKIWIVSSHRVTLHPLMVLLTWTTCLQVIRLSNHKTWTCVNLPPLLLSLTTTMEWVTWTSPSITICREWTSIKLSNHCGSLIFMTSLVKIVWLLIILV